MNGGRREEGERQTEGGRERGRCVARGVCGHRCAAPSKQGFQAEPRPLASHTGAAVAGSGRVEEKGGNMERSGEWVEGLREREREAEM